MRNRSAIFRHAATEWRAMRAEFELVLEATYARVERDTNGVMLNATGRREPITAWSLLTGPWSRVAKYGSPELIEWFSEHGRPSVEDFEREWWRARNEGPEPELAPAAGGNPDAIAAAGRKIAAARHLDTMRPIEVRITPEQAVQLGLRPATLCDVEGCDGDRSYTVECQHGTYRVCRRHFHEWTEVHPL
jgi:hypothetical protein